MILGGPHRRRLTYDQMSLTQFVQGFSKNILEEKEERIRESMVRYLSELMEDTDFSWSNTKAAPAVILCDMERGILQWGDTDKIDRIRRAHAQIQNNPGQYPLSKIKNLGFANNIKQMHVLLTKIMEVSGKFKGMFVLIV